jgi:hypothetical protein
MMKDKRITVLNSFSRIKQTLIKFPLLADLLAGLAGIVYLFQLIHFADIQYSVLDEGLYLYKGWLFATGAYVPFQDYGLWTNQMPMSYLIPGGAQMIFGTGLRTGRVFAIILALMMLLALWMISRRLGGRWSALIVAWAVALNPMTARLYSTATSQGLIACLLMWSLFFGLGSDRKRWQIFLSGLIAGLIVVVRINMIPLLPLLFIYIWREHGRKEALISALGMAIFFGGVHLYYFPGILKIWSRWIPLPFLSAWSPPQAIPSWVQNDPLSVKIDSFFLGIRYHFVALIGALSAWLLWSPRKMWRSDAHYRISVFLSALLIVLLTLHAWASLGNEYCTFCFPTYTAFYSGLGLLIFAVSAHAWRWIVSALKTTLINVIMLLLLAGMAHSAVKTINAWWGAQFLKNILATNIPRMGGGWIEAWQYASNYFKLSYEAIRDTAFTLVPVLLALAIGLVIIAIAAFASSILSSRKIVFGARGSITLILFLALGFILSPTILFSGEYQSYDCGAGQIEAYETSGTQIAQEIEAGAQIYWAGYSPVTLLYLPQANIYPGQLHLSYSLREGGADDLLRYGWWSKELAEQALHEADYVIIRERDYSDPATEAALNSGAFTELASTISVEICRPDSFLHVFRRNR